MEEENEFEMIEQFGQKRTQKQIDSDNQYAKECQERKDKRRAESEKEEPVWI